MTDTPITTPAEALEAAASAVAAETGFDDDHPAIAAIRALSARIAAPVAVVCPHCGRDSHSDSKVVE